MNYKFLINLILIFFFFESTVLSKDKKYEKLYLKGNEFFKIGEFDDAITYFKKAINLNSSYCPAIYKLGLSYKKLYDFTSFVEAFESYEDLLCEKFDDEVKFQLGEYHFLNGKIFLSQKYLKGINEKENFPLLSKYLINIDYYLNHQFDSSLFYFKSKSNISYYTFQYSPFINSSLNRIYFTGREGINLFDDEDIFYVEKDTYDSWKTPNKLSSKINTQNNEGSISFSSNSKFMVYTSCELNFKKNSCDLFYSEMIDGIWTIPKKMDQNINSNYWDSQPNLSSNGNILFFVSNRPGGQGGRDIWYSIRTNVGWSLAKNLSGGVNTEFDDIAPFISENLLDFYFSSNRTNSFGGFDIYRASNYNMDFGNVNNLGFEINNQLDQSSFAMSDGMVVYTEENIFNSTVKSELIIGKLNQVIDKDLSYHLSFLVMDSLTKKILRPNITLINSKIDDDLFTMDFNYEGRVYIERQNFEGESFLFNLKGYEPKIIKSQKAKTHSIVLMNRMKKYFVLENVYFDFDKYDLNVEVKKYLDIIYTWLLKNQNLKIEIGGHTDDVGGDVYNMNLSLKRAYSVYEYLTSKGGVDNLSYKGYGNSKPREDKVENSKNRRIEFIIL